MPLASDDGSYRSADESDGNVPEDAYLKKLVAQKKKSIQGVIEKVEKDLAALEREAERVEAEGIKRAHEHTATLITTLRKAHQRKLALEVEKNRLAQECMDEVNVLRKQLDAVLRGLIENARGVGKK